MDFHIFTIKITFPIGIYRVSCSPVPGGSPAYYMIWVYPDGHYDETNKKSQKHYLLQHNSKIYQIKKHAHSAKHPFQRAKLNTY